jgi:hypothetical protein
MTRRVHRRLILEFDLTDADSIAGRLSDPSGRATDFVGWLGLASAIESLSDTDAEDSAAATRCGSSD